MSARSSASSRSTNRLGMGKIIPFSGLETYGRRRTAKFYNHLMSANGSPLQVTFWGAARTVTGSMHLVDANGHQILLDCGFYQGKRSEARQRNSTFPFRPGDIHALVLSHAHIDHSGNIPNLVRQGFHGPIYCTPATHDLTAVMLADSNWTVAPTLFGTPVVNTEGKYVPSYSLVGDFGPLLFLGVLALPFILLKGKTEDSLGFVWLSFGAIAPFLVGETTLDYLTLFGLIVVLSWVLSKLPVSNGGTRTLVRRRVIKSGRSDLHVYEASLVLLLVIGSGLYLGTESALNPPKTTEWTAPMRAQASIAVAASGMVGR